MVFDITGGIEAHAQGHQVVHPLDLDAMTGEEEQADTAARCLLRKDVDGPLHRRLIDIRQERCRKTEAAQEICHICGIIDGIGEGIVGIGGVTNDEGTPGRALARRMPGMKGRQWGNRDRRGRRARS